MPNLALAFGALLGGAVIINYGVKSFSSAMSSPPAPTFVTSSQSVPASSSDVQDVRQAAARWGVPAWLLWGVYGVETSHGSNVSTSSANAQGKMQFIPETAAQYDYPLTNTPNASQSAQQFDAAAHYLHDLFNQHGKSWEAAVRAYSGGGYGLTRAQAEARGFVG